MFMDQLYKLLELSDLEEARKPYSCGERLR